MDQKRDDEVRTFTVERRNDESGVSGTGIVVEGAEFGDGRVVVRWTGDIGSLVIWNSLFDFMAINIQSHPTNKTIIRFSDGQVWEQE